MNKASRLQPVNVDKNKHPYRYFLRNTFQWLAYKKKVYLQLKYCIVLKMVC